MNLKKVLEQMRRGGRWKLTGKNNQTDETILTPEHVKSSQTGEVKRSDPEDDLA